ncbi:MAG: hypothetical protein Q8R31_05885 [Candidatus Omnitrophota bacterium]|nr:hypothetical protein [Candidatus Omnitrophota bacterium]
MKSTTSPRSSKDMLVQRFCLICSTPLSERQNLYCCAVCSKIGLATTLKRHWVELSPQDKIDRSKKTSIGQIGKAGKYVRTPEIRNKQSAIAKLRDPATRKYSALARANISASRKICWQNPEYRKKQQEAQRKATKLRWSDPEWAAKCHKSQRRKPTRPENNLSNLLDTYFPKQWKYVGNGEVSFDGKCPDFININGKKQVIEVFGVYWHPIFDVAIRTELFRQYGYETLVIWEDKLKDEQALLVKMKHFNKKCKVVSK